MDSLSAILLKARALHSLEPHQVKRLLAIEDPREEEELFSTALEVKERIFGKRILLFAPLYLSNECINDCLYCGFRKSNQRLVRRSLSLEEVVEEVRQLEDEGHRRILLVSSEKPSWDLVPFLEEAIRQIKSQTSLRSLHLNIPPLGVADCARLYLAGYGNYQVFQETYHWPTYFRMHPRGPKRNYYWRLGAMERAIRAGWTSLGMGILLGLYDWRYEVVKLVTHIRYLERKFGVGPRTISLPRLRPALGAPLKKTPCPVDERTFLRLLAIVRLAVPYAELVLSTREPASLRDQAIEVGVSQMSAGSRTSPGGYLHPERELEESQFYISDERTLEEILQMLFAKELLPSFSTIEDGFCELTVSDFLRLARRGRIRELVMANADLSLRGYEVPEAVPEIASAALRQAQDSSQ